MKKTGTILFILFITLSVTYGADKDGVAIYKIWAVGDNPDSPKIYIDPSNPSINIGLVNYDPYQRNVRVKAEYEGQSFESPLIPIIPNSHHEKIIEIRLKFTEVGDHSVTITLTDENGKKIESKKINVNVVNPVDVKNITCQASYTAPGAPYTEIVTSNWYTVTLKSNPRSQSDYEVKTWISVVSKDYTKDSNDAKNANDKKIIYNGKDDKRIVYLPKNSEKEVFFKIPDINIDENEFKIQVHTEVMGLHGYTDGLEETTRVNNNGLISYNYKKTVKIFKLPVSVEKYELFKDINESSRNYVKEFYDSSKIYDERIERALNTNIPSRNILPRAYMANEPYLSILRIQLRNHHNKRADVTVELESPSGYKTVKSVKIDDLSSETIYIPYLSKISDTDFKIQVYSDKHYVYSSKEKLKIEPEAIYPVIIDNISLPNDELLSYSSRLSGNVVVGKNYTVNVTLKNNYNRTLVGKVYIGNRYNEKNTYEQGIFTVNDPLTFRIAPNSKNTYELPIVFNREVNGPIEFIIDVDGAATDNNRKVTAQSTFFQFNAKNLLNVKKVWYNNTIMPKISTVNHGGGLFVNYPVAGYNNTCIVALDNEISIPATYRMWVDVYDSKGVLKATSKEKIVTVNNRNSNDPLQTVEFDIFFEEGFLGYTLFHAVTTDDFGNVEILYTEGFGTVSRNINPNSNIGRYSAIDLLNKVPTSMNKVTEVVSPLNIKDLTYSESGVTAIISSGLSSNHPVNITYYYNIEIQENKNTIYKSPNYQDMIHSTESKPLNIKLNELDPEKSYEITFRVSIPNFALKSGNYLPIELKKSLKINSDVIDVENSPPGINFPEIADNEEINHEVPNMDGGEDTLEPELTMIQNIMNSVKNMISKIPLIGGFVS